MTRKLIYCDTIADYRGILASPGAILIDGYEVIAVGLPEEIGTTGVHPIRVHGLVTPPFVNVHSHLDLSGIGIQPPENSFVSWIENTIAPIRKTSSENEMHAATQRGIELSLAGGTAMVGDIASTVAVAKQVRESVLGGVSFVEVFGLGSRETLAIDAINAMPCEFGISPHAPYSCGSEVFRKAFESGKPIATHLAELPEEFEATMKHVGSLVEFSKKIGAWNDQVKKWDNNPIDTIVGHLDQRKLIAAHLNYIEDPDPSAVQCSIRGNTSRKAGNPLFKYTRQLLEENTALKIDNLEKQRKLVLLLQINEEKDAEIEDQKTQISSLVKTIVEGRWGCD